MKDVLLGKVIFNKSLGYLTVEKYIDIDIANIGQFVEFCNKYFYPRHQVSTPKRMNLEISYKILNKLIESNRMKSLTVGEFIILTHEIAKNL